MDDKQLLRTGMCTARASRSAVDREAAGARLASHADALVALARRTDRDEPAESHSTIAAYAGVADEPPTRSLLDALVAHGVTVLLPVVASTDRALDWAPYEGWERLTNARWGLLEPTSDPLGARAIETAGLVVVPALAVDRRGHRLGRGGGFYDRALENVERERRVAVVYATELLANVPSEPHDEDVGWVLTPDGVTELTG